MINHHLKSISALALLGALALASPAGARELCEVLDSNTCPGNCYKYVSPVTEGTEECNEAAYVVTEVDRGTAPGPAVLVCETHLGGFLCEAWPQSEDISYDWAGFDGIELQPASDESNPFRNLTCSDSDGGIVGVSVIGPSGATTTAAITLPACSSQ